MEKDYKALNNILSAEEKCKYFLKRVEELNKLLSEHDPDSDEFTSLSFFISSLLEGWSETLAAVVLAKAKLGIIGNSLYK